MRISELIDHLRKAQESHGDVEVRGTWETCVEEISAIYFDPKRSVWDRSARDHVPRPMLLIDVDQGCAPENATGYHWDVCGP